MWSVMGATGGPWISASAGNQFTLALKADGTASAWGHNASGQLGVGDTNARHAPTAIGSTVQWVAISAGDSHALGIQGDGTLWAWGLNDKGQVGNNSTQNQTTPVQIAGAWVAVSAGGKFSLAIRSDGTLWAWGDNGKGQLGCTGCASPQKTPFQVGSGYYQYIAVGFDFSIAVTADGNLWSWGNNAGGELGNGGLRRACRRAYRTPRMGRSPQSSQPSSPVQATTAPLRRASMGPISRPLVSLRHGGTTLLRTC